MLQRRATNKAKTINFSADAETLKLIAKIEKLAHRLTGQKPTKAVIIRRAMRELWLYYINAIHEAATHPDPGVCQRMGRRLQETEAQLLYLASKGQ